MGLLFAYTADGPVLSCDPWILADNAWSFTIVKDMIDTSPSMTGSCMVTVLHGQTLGIRGDVVIEDSA
jgi:hypothetical protein